MREPKRPGVMLYFDLYDVLRQMPMEDACETEDPDASAYI